MPFEPLKADKDTLAVSEGRKVFIGGINHRTTDDGMRHYFCTFGKVENCMIMRDRTTGSSRGFGFVTFGQKEVANKVLKDKKMFLDDRRLNAEVAIKKNESVEAAKLIDGNRVNKLFIGGVPFAIDDGGFYDFFAKFGAMEDCVLMHDRTGLSRGFGFVTYKTVEAMNACLANQKNLGDRTLDIKLAVPQREMDRQEKLKHGMRPLQNHRVFVAGISSDITDGELREYFKRFGAVEDCIHMRTKQGASRGFGFVTYETEDAAKRVVGKQHILPNKTRLRCEMARPEGPVDSHLPATSGGYVTWDARGGYVKSFKDLGRLDYERRLQPTLQQHPTRLLPSRPPQLPPQSYPATLPAREPRWQTSAPPLQQNMIVPLHQRHPDASLRQPRSEPPREVQYTRYHPGIANQREYVQQPQHGESRHLSQPQSVASDRPLQQPYRVESRPPLQPQHVESRPPLQPPQHVEHVPSSQQHRYESYDVQQPQRFESRGVQEPQYSVSHFSMQPTPVALIDHSQPPPVALSDHSQPPPVALLPPPQPQRFESRGVQEPQYSASQYSMQPPPVALSDHSQPPPGALLPPPQPQPVGSHHPLQLQPLHAPAPPQSQYISSNSLQQASLRHPSHQQQPELQPARTQQNGITPAETQWPRSLPHEQYGGAATRTFLSSSQQTTHMQQPAAFLPPPTRDMRYGDELSPNVGIGRQQPQQRGVSPRTTTASPGGYQPVGPGKYVTSHPQQGLMQLQRAPQTSYGPAIPQANLQARNRYTPY